ncbi:MAG: hypothetical protein K2X82_16065 [Gemmataceae bacterium]|nr:hypothetical protein [Gemmataceae bacterium]
MNPNDLALWAIVFLGALLVAWQVVTIRFTVAGVERKLDRLLAHFEVDPHPPLSDRAKGLAREGRTIEAIRAVRAETGAGLAEAKAAVEAYQATAGE